MHVLFSQVFEDKGYDGYTRALARVPEFPFVIIIVIVVVVAVVVIVIIIIMNSPLLSASTNGVITFSFVSPQSML